MPLFQGFCPVAGTICPSLAAAVVGPSRAPQGMKKGRRPRRRPRLKLSDKAGPDQCPVPGENALFPAQIAGFLAVSRPVPVYPVFLNYVVPVHFRSWPYLYRKRTPASRPCLGRAFHGLHRAGRTWHRGAGRYRRSRQIRRACPPVQPDPRGPDPLLPENPRVSRQRGQGMSSAFGGNRASSAGTAAGGRMRSGRIDQGTRRGSRRNL